MVSLAIISILPAFPRPKVLASTSPPLVKDKELVVILISPADPSASSPTELIIPLAKPSESSPSIEMVSLAIISTLPALPRLKVVALTCPPLVKDKELVVMLISPADPSASD